jgi:hypothetical protein
MNFAISNNYSPNFMAKKPPRVSKHIGDGFKHFKETDPEGYQQFITAINEKNPLKLPKVKSSAVDFYKKQGFENVPPKDLLFIPKTEIK